MKKVLKIFLLSIITTTASGQNITGWTFWSESPLRASSSTVTLPVKHVGLHVYNDKQWSLTSDALMTVSPGQTWTFSAIVSARFLKELSPTGSAYMGLISYNNSGILNWNAALAVLPSGTFNWQKITVQYTVPVDGSVTRLRARFFGGSGGGELYVTGTEMSTASNNSLLIPDAPIPAARANLMSLMPRSNSLDWSMPSQWSFWSQSPLRATSGFYNDPVPHVEARVYNNGQWSLSGSSMAVNPGETWTISAVVAGRQLGELSSNPSGFISLLASNQSGVVNWTPVLTPLPRGTFGWTKVSVQYTVPTDGSVTRITPRFFAEQGGGELYVQEACALPTTNIPNLEIPSGKIPDSKANIGPFYNESITPFENTWSLWSQTGKARISMPSIPYCALQLNTMNGDSGPEYSQWDLSAKLFETVPGETWTFNAFLTSVANSNPGNVYMGIVTYNSQRQIVNWNAAMKEVTEIDGSLQKYNVSYTIPSDGSVAFVRPRFFANSWQGIMRLLDANFIPIAKTTDFCASKNIPISVKKFNGVYLNGQQIQWLVGTDLSLTGLSLTYKIIDAYGNLVFSGGSIAAGSTISFSPQTPGYYELRISGTGTESGHQFTIEGKSSAISIVNANTTFGSNPFAISFVPNDSLYNILGLTWDRPLTYNIKYIDDQANPLWKTLPPSNLLSEYEALWKAYATDPTKEFNKLKYIGSHEIWNEPVNESVINGQDFTQNCGPFVDMMEATFKGLSGTGKKILLNLEHPGYYGAINSHVTASGMLGANLYDVMSIHPYTTAYWDRNSLCPEGSYSQGVDAWGQPGDFSGNPLLSDLQRFNDNNTNGKQVWSTEFGWATHPNYSFSTSELNQARYIVRSSLLQLSARLKKIMVFRWKDVPYWPDLDGSFGVTRTDDTPKPALCAYSVLARVIHDLPYVGFISKGTNNGVFVFSKNTSTNKKTILVLWRPDIETNLSISLPAGEKTIVDMFGREYTTLSSITSLPIGRSPLYVIVKNKNPSEFLTGIIEGTPPSDKFSVGKGF
jgi:hypothetical protein